MIKLEQPLASVTLVAPQFEELTVINAASFKEHMLALIEKGHSRFVIDMAQVNQVDSTGIVALVNLLKRIGLRGEVMLCGLTDRVAQVFRLTRMDRIFAIHGDSAGALRAMGA